MELSESAAFIVACIILLRTCGGRTIKRRTRIALISLGFVAVHLIRNLLSPEPLLLATGGGGSLASNDGGIIRSSSSKDLNLRYASATDASLVVFYNLFVPRGNDDDGGGGAAAAANTAIDVAKDQMGQVASALRRLEKNNLDGNGNGNDDDPPPPPPQEEEEGRGVVFYNLIGDGDALPPDEMDRLCRASHPRLECLLLRRYDDATESVTLASLHEYCHHAPHRPPRGARGDAREEEDNNNRTTAVVRVAYLHSKGSYHDHGKQRPWRRHLTDAALHPDCLRPPSDECDVCGAQFYTVWGPMFPGNMWTASCRYVRKLLPPVEEGGEVVRRRERAAREFLLRKAEGTLRNTLGFHQDVFYGLDRYQWEHWVGSHPSIVPCDLHVPRVSFWDMVEGKVVGDRDYEWAMGPRRFMVFDKPGKRKPYLTDDEDANSRQYYYVAGNLIKWIGLYETVPAQDSWVWSHFPAGQRWKELVDEHGTDAVNAMVESSNPLFHSAFVSSNNSATPMQMFDEEALSVSKSPIVVFYQISYPAIDKEKAGTAIEAQFEVLSMGQYDNVANVYDRDRKILLYYTTAGGSPQENASVSQLCEKHSNRVTCRQLGSHQTEFASGETLRHLHAFCNARPSSNAIYITNQLSDLVTSESRYDATKLKATTSAILSKNCVPSKECNVCGTEFYPLPFIHFAGNMFSTSCSYVRDLLPPPTLEKEMYDIAGDVLLAHLRKQVTTELFKLTPQTSGLHHHSVAHWIGGHPDLKPCDVAPTGTEKSNEADTDSAKRRSTVPRHGSAPPGFLDADGESRFRSRREVAFREYYYLAGNVLRWHRLYGKVPGADSWAWQWFPDGRLWQAAARASGGDALKEIAKQLGSDGGSMEQFWVE